MTEESAGKLATDAVNVLGPSLDDNEQAQELEDILSNPHIGVRSWKRTIYVERGRTMNGEIGPVADQIYEICNGTIFVI